MAKVPTEAQQVFNDVSNVVFATANTTSQPNVCIVGMKKIIDDETIYLSDQFFNKTLANLKSNDKVAIIFWNDKGAYEVYGTAHYVNEGAEFEEQKAWVDAAFKSMGKPIRTKGGVFVHVDEVYTSAPGPNAGAQIA